MVVVVALGDTHTDYPRVQYCTACARRITIGNEYPILREFVVTPTRQSRLLAGKCRLSEDCLLL